MLRRIINKIKVAVGPRAKKDTQEWTIKVIGEELRKALEKDIVGVSKDTK